MAFWSQLTLQDPASPLMVQLVSFHNHIMLVLILVMTFVSYMLASTTLSKLTSSSTLEAHKLEIVWTILPALILVGLALPSLRILYLMDEAPSPAVTLKAIGHQWYWSYEYTDLGAGEGKKFDSYMLPSPDSMQYRLLEVDNRVVLPLSMDLRLLITAADVIHSWTVPSLGIKVDAIPGRLNQLSTLVSRPGVFYGQCSEICGANHSFMPIAVEVVDTPTFTSWLGQ